ncbi:LLM class flavin-dependent oxidoreductase [Jeotgalibaca sp. MA1X17-3]|uniref:LLM class flavin-dependent oxidoreductase n=1 Tax=Jeotgalibaca sp. MA1X17-3 TaxID=2908211 RepID=UPI001F2AD0E4|nr:LLM class flavin-dependent oxidoreductase [Jeotgalibaca sp. MA1X17-3]UJF16416.1 LLM class flavin-dependent oxidoreductase [Jeotgalibaca sp. MA1X17-3]
MKISILDQVPVMSGSTAREALNDAVTLAQHAEKWGYERIWFSEHHGGESLASSAPEIIVAQVAAKTEKIRVGTGGIMMMHYSPLKISETFKTLEAFHPGRIDLGLGRAPGGDRNAIMALSQGKLPLLNNMYEKAGTIQNLLLDETPKEDLYSTTKSIPTIEEVPSMWLLGSSGDSARNAAQMGMGYSYAQFFSGKMNREAFDQYNENFVSSSFMQKKNISVAFYALACPTEAEAQYYALPYMIFQMKLARGQRLGKFLTPQEAAEYPLTEMEKMMIEKISQGHLIGTPQQIHDRLKTFQDEFQFDEAMLVTITHPQEIRLRSYQLLAKEILSVSNEK